MLCVCIIRLCYAVRLSYSFVLCCVSISCVYLVCLSRASVLLVLLVLLVSFTFTPLPISSNSTHLIHSSYSSVWSCSYRLSCSFRLCCCVLLILPPEQFERFDSFDPFDPFQIFRAFDSYNYLSNSSGSIPSKC